MHFKFAAELGMCCKCYVTTSSQDGSTTKLAMCFNVTCSSYSLIVPLLHARTNSVGYFQFHGEFRLICTMQ